MRNKFKFVVQKVLQLFDLSLIRRYRLEGLLEYENDINSILSSQESKLEQLILVKNKSKSQLKQDLFVLSELDFKKNGFFVEFGAANGIDLSNSYLLEKEFGWHGILAEPARCWHPALRANRRAEIETKCVWRDSASTLQFNEVDVAELSTINLYKTKDHHAAARKNSSCYDVDTISLNDLLRKYNAPNVIDYLSIDTEGSEYEILKSFDFSKYKFNIITCEHNFTPMRKKIFKLLTDNGYARKFIGLSKWDDWYTHI